MMASNLHVLLFGVLCVASIIKVIYCQDACERITSDNLGRSDMLGNTGLVATILNPVGKDVNAVDVRILNMTIVCEAQHRMQDRYRYTSVVVSFNCQQQTVKFNVSECANMSVVYTEQYDFGCIDGTWSPNTFTVSTAARTANPTATLSTGLNTSCIACINPSNPEAENLAFVDNITHCLGKFVFKKSAYLLAKIVILCMSTLYPQDVTVVLWVFSDAMGIFQFKFAATTSLIVLV